MALDISGSKRYVAGQTPVSAADLNALIAEVRRLGNFSLNITGGKSKVQDSPSGRAITLTIDGERHKLIQVKVQVEPTTLGQVSVKKLDENDEEEGDAFDASYYGADSGVAQGGDDAYINPTPAVDDVLDALVWHEGEDDEVVHILPKIAQISDDVPTTDAGADPSDYMLDLDAQGRLRMHDLADHGGDWVPKNYIFVNNLRWATGVLEMEKCALVCDSVGRVLYRIDLGWSVVPGS